ncbi:beta family protein [Roseibium sp. CAU 1637]|uniref:Beta family protein n=1 Tax=Roseibium limicola TaxID=2816037 RepID=A0A939J6T1_9HYPH|nr:beta family protein [Roseibium limicola]MBO0347195.1 beta family protein [Roseibium limicola]
MAMDVQEYLVTLGVRPAELSGLKELPGSTKDRLTPLVLLAPWLSTTPLTRALDKFEEAYPSRPYFIDVDTYYRMNDKPNEAKELWARLAEKPADLDAWWQLLLEYPKANPCLLMAERTIESAREQINWARENDRTFCLRMNLAEGIGSGIPQWMPALVVELAAEGANDYAVVFEFGWVPDPLQMAALAIGYTNNFFSTIPLEVPIAISCTSFPKDFTVFDGTDVCNFTNRNLLAQVQQATNHPKIIYGDWGTTRPRSYGHSSQPKYRIDYPTDRSWVIARNKADPISFQEAAQRITSSPQWAGNLGIWGEQLIEATAAGQAFAIDTMPKMYSARINIHLHRQAYYGHLPPPDALDEEWSDDAF